MVVMRSKTRFGFGLGVSSSSPSAAKASCNSRLTTVATEIPSRWAMRWMARAREEHARRLCLRMRLGSDPRRLPHKRLGSHRGQRARYGLLRWRDR